ncbi:hypothetical protein [Burkholderia ubonensis]|nr:hypothetical protein [Burkholderia ubonensis]
MLADVLLEADVFNNEPPDSSVRKPGGTTMGNFRGEWRGGGFKN